MEFILLSPDKDTYAGRRFLSEAQALGLSTRHLCTKESLLTISPGQKMHKAMVFHRASGVTFDEYDLHWAKWLQNQGAQVFNSPQTIERFRDKAQQLLELQSAGLPTIPSIALRGRPTPEIIAKIQDTFAPFQGHEERFVLKTIRGNQGLGVTLINGPNSLHSILETLWAMQDQRFILQPYLEDFQEIRAFLVQGQTIIIMQKEMPTSDFRRNSTHAIFSTIAPDTKSSELNELIERIAKISGAFYLGPDIIKFRGKYYVSELNLMPGFEQVEKVAKINIASLLISKAMQTF